MKKGLSFKLFIIVSLFIVALLFFFTLPKISLNGGNVIVKLNDEYMELGYQAKTLWFDISNVVTLSNNIDTSNVGNYEVTYKINFIKKVRHVRVIELESPIITLEGNENYYVCPKHTYTEPGYTATDNYDGDITDRVGIEKNDNVITYNVADSSGNLTTIKRNIFYEDIEKPTIELVKGDMSMKVGSNYTDPGYKATDNCLGDITDKVEVLGNVNTNIPGTYTITYKVSDGKNVSIVKRNIHVTKGIATLGTDNSAGVIYLTFDDGPSPYTKIVLDTLKKYKVKATFFVVPKDSSLHHYIKDAYNDGHSIGIHSMSHTYSLVYASDDSFKDDVLKTNNVIKNLIGNYTYLYRFPGGSSNTASLHYSKGIISRMASWLHDEGYHYFDWNVSSGDADGRWHSSDEIASNVINRLSKNRYNVVLMHDSKDFSSYAVEKIILYGIDNGYTFSNITMNTKEVHHGIAN